MKAKSNQANWNQFQGKMRILRKEQDQILKRFRDRLTKNQIETLRKSLNQ